MIKKKKKDIFKLDIINNFENKKISTLKKFSSKKLKNSKIFTFSNKSKKNTILRKYTNLLDNEKKRKNVFNSFLGFYNNFDKKKKKIFFKKKKIKNKKIIIKKNYSVNISCLGKYFSPIEQFYRSKIIC